MSVFESVKRVVVYSQFIWADQREIDKTGDWGIEVTLVTSVVLKLRSSNKVF